MFKIITVISLVLSLIFLSDSITTKENIVPKDAIRLRVIAHSNSVHDQYIKTKVREKLQIEVYDLLKGIENIEDARVIIKNELKTLKNIVTGVLEEEQYNKTYELVYGSNYFPVKTYKGITYDEGYYESLLVTIGEGKGNNWWCVLFPPLCLIEAEEANEVEYKFFVSEIINRFLKR